jgi:hypothetical protein
MTRSTHQPTKRVAGRQGKETAQGKPPAKLLVAMTGKASRSAASPSASMPWRPKVCRTSSER